MTPIALTPGEPAGIGPDLLIALAPQFAALPIVVIADPELLEDRARVLGLPVAIEIAGEPRSTTETPALTVLPVRLRAPVRCGHADPANAAYVLETLDRAVDGCLAGRYSAMVTGPVHKGIISDSGVAFSGHTEYLGERCATPSPVMLLEAPGIRVALVTTHLPLGAVSGAITSAHLETVLRIVHEAMRTRFGLANPRLDVCGLNPHAGESGHLGNEENEVIIPVIETLRAQGLSIDGPLPADTAFTPQRLRGTDVTVTMYHDQGLPVLKHMGFGSAVNITLGLPIIRTSVDHGTALELAGTGNADTGSMVAAVNTAIRLVRTSQADASEPCV